MTAVSATGLSESREFTKNFLALSAKFWLITAIAGQWLFAYYIMVFYGSSALEGDWQTWSRRMIHGIIEGDWLGNLAVFLHILLAFVISFCGPLQLIPQLRNNFPQFHRFNGRLYITTALVMSVASIYMIWTREAIIGGFFGQLGTSLDGVLIFVFAIMALKTAMARRFDLHRRWALRLFIVVSGVWFFRVIRGFWMFIHDGSSPGTNGNLTGPFDLVLNFAGYLVPLLILEIYLRVRDKGQHSAQLVLSSVIFALTIAMAIGIYSAAHIFWLPNI